MAKKWLARLSVILVNTLPVAHAEGLFPEYIDSQNGRLFRCSLAGLKAFGLIHVGNASMTRPSPHCAV
jgi:hypothetical protein